MIGRDILDLAVVGNCPSSGQVFDEAQREFTRDISEKGEAQYRIEILANDLK